MSPASTSGDQEQSKPNDISEAPFADIETKPRSEYFNINFVLFYLFIAWNICPNTNLTIV